MITHIVVLVYKVLSFIVEVCCKITSRFKLCEEDIHPTVIDKAIETLKAYGVDKINHKEKGELIPKESLTDKD